MIVWGEINSALMGKEIISFHFPELPHLTPFYRIIIVIS
jgi:hypothetical protein